MKNRIFFSLLLVISFTGHVHGNNNSISAPEDSIFTEIKIWLGQRNITFKGGETCRFSIDSVETGYLQFFKFNGEQLFSTTIFITPGDSVSVKPVFDESENRYEPFFEGINAAHYNYFSQKEKLRKDEVLFFLKNGYTFSYHFFDFSIRKEQPLLSPNYDPDIDLHAYKLQQQIFRDRENEFLNNYKKEHAVSEDFINYASAQISNEYAYELYKCAVSLCMQVPAGYLDDAVVIENPLVEIRDLLIFKYIHCSGIDRVRVYNAILNEVNPTYRSTLLDALIVARLKTCDREYSKSLLQVMDQIEKTTNDSILLARIQEYKPYYSLSGIALPDSVLDKTYLRSFQNKEEITLRQLFNKYKNRAIYFDVWASWCPPCRKAIKESSDGKSYLAEKQVAIVYISVDKDENRWLKASEEDQITENQYLLLKDDNNCLMYDYLKIKKLGIPIYILFDKNHEVEILDAPGPNECMFEEMKQVIERYPERFGQ